MFYTRYEAEFTSLQLAANDEGLKLLLFEGGKHARNPIPAEWVADVAPFRETIRQLDAYFAGELTEFDVPLAPDGTDFQKRVWTVLSTIPYGTTLTYGEVAKRIGQPNASRAVGAANGQNPISIIVPCHRVIGSSGKLVGFGGGVPAKQSLLEHERRFAPHAEPALF